MHHMKTFLRSFCLALMIGVPVAVSTWAILSMRCDIKVGIGQSEMSLQMQPLTSCNYSGNSHI